MFRAVVVAIVLVGGCGRIGFAPNGDAGADADAGPMGPPWADYVDTLGLPPCAEMTNVLTVDTVADEGDGGETLADPAAAGTNLSLREAIRIAFNRAGPDTILFSESVFPAASPGRIVISLLDPPLTGGITELSATCIDARRRGVIVEWTGPDDICTRCIWSLGPGSRQIGLVLLRTPAFFVRDATVAGCRFNTDGITHHPAFDSDLGLRGTTATIGPGNAFGDVRFTLVNGTSATMVRNHFGFDPVTRRQIANVAMSAALSDAVPSFYVDGNVFAASSHLIGNFLGPGPKTIILVGNRFGVDELGELVPDPHGIVLGTDPMSVYQFGPDNVVRNTTEGLRIGTSGSVKITRNQIYGNAVGIFYASVPVLPPAITIASPSTIQGTCTVDGTIEVFSDLGNQGEIFLGQTPCLAASDFTFNGSIPQGRNVTATLTDAASRTSPFSVAVAVP